MEVENTYLVGTKYSFLKYGGPGKRSELIELTFTPHGFVDEETGEVFEPRIVTSRGEMVPAYAKVGSPNKDLKDNIVIELTHMVQKCELIYW